MLQKFHHRRGQRQKLSLQKREPSSDLLNYPSMPRLLRGAQLKQQAMISTGRFYYTERIIYSVTYMNSLQSLVLSTLKAGYVCNLFVYSLVCVPLNVELI